MSSEAIRARRWSREEYEHLVEQGIFGRGERVELLGGALIVREPQGSPHMTAIGLVDDRLRLAFGPGWIVRTQGPVALDDESEPEPDVAVVRGTRRDYASGHPTRPALLVEVAESSLVLDREQKGSLYARARVAEYWILNLIDRALEVYREPTPAAEAQYGWRYRTVSTLQPGAFVSPLAAPAARISVADLLP
jgi:Uma2 family endonuclease